MNDRDSSLATVLELIFGFFALPGVGWIYAGEVGTGLMVLGGYWAVMIAASIALFGLTLLTLGCGSLLFVLLIPLHLATPIISSMKLNRHLTGVPVVRAGSPGRGNRMDRVFETDRPVVIVQKSGMSSGQVMILILLTVIACIVSCGVLAAIGTIVSPPPG